MEGGWPDLCKETMAEVSITAHFQPPRNSAEARVLETGAEPGARSVTLAKRVDIYSWQAGTIRHTYLDIDGLQECARARIHEPRKVAE